jgi:hypothetical protein
VFTLKTLREFLLREKGEKCVLFSPRKRKPPSQKTIKGLSFDQSLRESTKKPRKTL